MGRRAVTYKLKLVTVWEYFAGYAFRLVKSLRSCCASCRFKLVRKCAGKFVWENSRENLCGENCVLGKKRIFDPRGRQCVFDAVADLYLTGGWVMPQSDLQTRVCDRGQAHFTAA